MASTAIYSVAGISFILVALLFHFATKSSCGEKSKSIVTKTFSERKPIVSTFVSTKIKGTADGVFSAIMDYESYPTWSPSTEYTWEDTDSEGVPVVGSIGTFKVTVDFATRIVPVQMKILDRKNRLVAEESILYPNWLLRSERVQEVVPIDGEPGFCEYRTQHNLYGLASYYLLLTSKEDLVDLQNQYAGDLKFLVEGKMRFKSAKR
ncbi:hypothetical protein IFR05_002224 [Cadophora sp. M221]|nr:hypothetical protein IFR05_002224 [Cadophora sp. M221]